MKIYAISDLHLDDYKQEENEALARFLPEADILVMAGDFCNGKDKIGRFYNFVELVKPKYKHVIFVMGNHDHWGWDFENSHNAFSKVKDAQVHFLQESLLTLSDFPDYVFYGGTLWYQESDPYWIDERRTIGGKDIIKANKVFKSNLETLSLSIPKDKKLICVSHHLPSNNCIAPQFVGAYTNEFFVDSSCEPLIKNIKPALWIHGHTHEYTETKFADTRIIANPRGYDGEHDGQFLINAINRIIEV